MPRIVLHTEIEAKQDIVFDLSRSIDLHVLSTRQTYEQAIAGKTSGLIGLGESVTWRAKHFGFYQKLTAKITEFDRPHYFVDEMVQGAFKKFTHHHQFETQNGKVLMTDTFDYESPIGTLGRIADAWFLKKYMTEFLSNRNQVIKEIAESNDWQELIKQ